MFYAAALVALIVLNGFSLNMAPLCLFLLLFALIHDLPHPNDPRAERFALTRRLMAILSLAFCLAAVKLIPIFELLRVNDRRILDYHAAADKALTYGKLFAALLTRGPYAVGNEDVAGPNGLGSAVMYFGGTPCALFAFSCIFAFKRVWRYLALAAVFASLGMALHAPVDLFRALHLLPLFRSIHEPARYFSFPLVFLFPLIACAVFSTPRFVSLRNELRLLAYALAFLGAVDMFIANRQYYEFTALYQEKPPPRRLTGPVFGVEIHRDDLYYRGKRTKSKVSGGGRDVLWFEPHLSELPMGLQFYTVRQNIGLTNWFANIDLKQTTVPRYRVKSGFGDYWKDLRADPTPANGVFPVKGYRGEAYFAQPKNKALSVEWSANRIDVSVDQAVPGRLIVNQNFNEGWAADTGRVSDADGLLSVVLDTPAKGTIRLRYRPFSFFLGALISLLAAVLFFRRRSP